jgi:hypothetical protein
MTQPGSKQFCPLAMAAELLCTRWTMVLLRELVAGSMRFNDLRRGVPKMSPTLLSQRLKELEAAGVIERRNPASLPKRRTVIQFLYHELPVSKRSWWLVVEPDGEVDLCWSDPGFDVDLYVSTDLRTMTAIWMGLTTVAKEREKVALTGARHIASHMQTWLGLSPFAVEPKRASA